ncbi:MAG: dTMP kinase [Bacteroidota bacterium]
MSETPARGRFIVFEGIDGSGKSTQVELLAERLRSQDHTVYLTRQPSDRTIGKLLRSILTGKERTDERAIAALFLADRIDHITAVEDGLIARLERGETVICDRYYFSSLAYNSLKIPMDWVLTLHQPVFELLRPDLTLFLDLPVEESLRRIRENRADTEHYEKLDTLIQVRENYMTAFRRREVQENIQVVNAHRTVEEIAADIREIVDELA